MNTLLTVIIVIQVLSALTIIGLVLLQHGKGADMGAAFGSGASGSLFGATGSSNFLSKFTGIAAAIFFGATLALAFFGNRPAVGSGGVMDQLPATSVPAPAAGSAAPAGPASIPTSKAPVAAGAPNVAPTTNKSTGTAGQSNQIPK